MIAILPAVLTLGGAVFSQAGPGASAERWSAPAGVQITIVGPQSAIAPVREVTTDLLTRDGVVVFWRTADALRAEDVIAAPIATRAPAIDVWVDVSSGVEARIYFRAATGPRFVIRRVSLLGGVGALDAEEIAQIIQSVLRALAADTAWALSLAEARAALSVPEPRTPPVAPPPSRGPVVDVGSALVGQSYASELPFVGGLEISLGVSRPPSASPSAIPGSFGGRVALGYAWPAHVVSGAVGADLQAARLRLALVWDAWRGGRASIRFGLGGGADRVVYAPTAEQPGATAASGGSFVAAMASADAALRFELSPRVALATAALVEISLQRLHYDAYDASGNLAEVLVPYRVRPGLRIGLEVRL